MRNRIRDPNKGFDLSNRRMQVQEEHIEDELFSEFVQHMPQCCVEIVVTTDDGVLLAERTNEPVKGEWFWPGSRLYKGEDPRSSSPSNSRGGTRDQNKDTRTIGSP